MSWFSQNNGPIEVYYVCWSSYEGQHGEHHQVSWARGYTGVIAAGLRGEETSRGVNWVWQGMAAALVPGKEKHYFLK